MKFEESAGGIVYKKEHGKTFILVSKHSQHHGWVFPKGRIGDEIANESKEETAIREVKEETGIDGVIEIALSPVSYFYVWEEERIKKTVYYFIMNFVGGNIEEHDYEMEEVEWIEKEKVLDRLTYPSDKKVWQEAQKYIN